MTWLLIRPTLNDPGLGILGGRLAKKNQWLAIL